MKELEGCGGDRIDGSELRYEDEKKITQSKEKRRKNKYKRTAVMPDLSRK